MPGLKIVQLFIDLPKNEYFKITQNYFKWTCSLTKKKKINNLFWSNGSALK